MVTVSLVDSGMEVTTYFANLLNPLRDSLSPAFIDLPMIRCCRKTQNV